MKNHGFTIVEFLVVMAIIAILASLSTPLYSNYVSRAKISVAQSDLKALALNFENLYQRTLAYPSVAYADTESLKAAMGNWAPASEGSEFSFSSSNASFSTYTITATGSRAGVAGCSITLTHDGVKSISTCSAHSKDGNWL